MGELNSKDCTPWVNSRTTRTCFDFKWFLKLLPLLLNNSSWSCADSTPWKINMEPTNHAFRKEK